MQINKIVDRLNQLLAGEMYDYSFFEPFLDETIDDINDALNTIYPCFSDVVAAGLTEYNLFPERYIRNVVIKGAAHKFYTMDEEGIDSAEQYGWDYQKNLFMMYRDYSCAIPEEYQSESTGSVIFQTAQDVLDAEALLADEFPEVMVGSQDLPTIIKVYKTGTNATVKDNELIITEETEGVQVV